MEANCCALYSLRIFATLEFNWTILFCSSIMLLPGRNLECVHRDVSQFNHVSSILNSRMWKKLICERFYHEVVMEANYCDYSLTISTALEFNWKFLFLRACIEVIHNLIMFLVQIEYCHSEFSDANVVKVASFVAVLFEIWFASNHKCVHVVMYCSQ